jgi:hypothetical protein
MILPSHSPSEVFAVSRLTVVSPKNRGPTHILYLMTPELVDVRPLKTVVRETRGPSDPLRILVESMDDHPARAEFVAVAPTIIRLSRAQRREFPP